MGPQWTPDSPPGVCMVSREGECRGLILPLDKVGKQGQEQENKQEQKQEQEHEKD